MSCRINDIYWMHEINVGAIRKGKPRETSNIEHTRRRQTKQKHNTICVGHYYTHTNTNNENKTWDLLQTAIGIEG
jgi:hypothetical protein